MPNSPFGRLPAQAPLNHMLGRLAYLDGLPTGIFHVRDEKASGTGGGTSVNTDITQTRTLNTIVVNTINGASLSSNQITLPPGTYTFDIRCPAKVSFAHKAFLYNVTDSSYAGIGSSAISSSGSAVCTDSTVKGEITIQTTKTFAIRHYTQGAVADGLGGPVGAGQVEVYSEAIFRRWA